MRVIAGRLGGLIFDSPRSVKTHPMSEKLRGAIFASLGDIYALSVLDAYSGSGAIAFEALSRGASKVTSVESSRESVKTIKANSAQLKLTNIHKVIGTSVEAWLTTSDDTFDIIIADPPYDNLAETTISRLFSRLNREGICVLSWPPQEPLPSLAGLQVIRDKTYGDARLVFYRAEA